MKVFWILSLSKLWNKYLQHSSPFRIRCFKKFSVFLFFFNSRSSYNWSSFRTSFWNVCTSSITRSICSIICNFIYLKFSLTFFLHIPVTQKQLYHLIITSFKFIYHLTKTDEMARTPNRISKVALHWTPLHTTWQGKKWQTKNNIEEENYIRAGGNGFFYGPGSIHYKGQKEMATNCWCPMFHRGWRG